MNTQNSFVVKRWVNAYSRIHQDFSAISSLIGYFILIDNQRSYSIGEFKIGCFVKKDGHSLRLTDLNLTGQEVNCTEPFLSERILC
jgi:hypothetical protein